MSGWAGIPTAGIRPLLRLAACFTCARLRRRIGLGGVKQLVHRICGKLCGKLSISAHSFRKYSEL